MSTDANTRPSLTIAQMDDLVDRHFRAEETGDLQAIAAGFTVDAEWLLSPEAKVPQAILFAQRGRE